MENSIIDVTNRSVVVECPLKGAGKGVFFVNINRFSTICDLYRKILPCFKRELEKFCDKKKMSIQSSLKHVTNMLVVIVDCSVVEFLLNKIRPTSALLI